MLVVRRAESGDAEAMSGVLEEIIAAGWRTKPGDPDFARSHYIEHAHRIACSVAIDSAGRMLGFQSLKLAHEGNPYGTPAGWGIIGTHVRPSAARTGVGSRLFEATLAAARKFGLSTIEAFIGEQNSTALRYYDAIGFHTYRRSDGIICKRFDAL
jgi:GNAT superfamily N-acetyltransferase